MTAEAWFMYELKLGELDAMSAAVARAARARNMATTPAFAARNSLRWDTGDASMNHRYDELVAPLTESVDVLNDLARLDALPDVIVVELLEEERTPATEAALNALSARAGELGTNFVDQS